MLASAARHSRDTVQFEPPKGVYEDPNPRSFKLQTAQLHLSGTHGGCRSLVHGQAGRPPHGTHARPHANIHIATSVSTHIDRAI